MKPKSAVQAAMILAAAYAGPLPYAPLERTDYLGREIVPPNPPQINWKAVAKDRARRKAAKKQKRHARKMKGK